MGGNTARRRQEWSRYLHALLRWVWLLALCAVVGGAAGFVASKLQHPVYRATALLIVDQRSSSSSDPYSNLLASDQLVQTDLNLVKSTPVMNLAARTVGGISAEQLAQRVRTANPGTSTQILQIQADDPSPTRAAFLANAVASALIALQQQTAQAEFTQASQQLTGQLATLTSQIDGLNAQIGAIQANNPQDPQLAALQSQLAVLQQQRDTIQTASANLTTQALVDSNNVRIFQAAQPPLKPDHPVASINAAIGGLAGLLLAGMLVVALEAIDDRIRTAADVEEIAGLSTVGTVGNQRGPRVLLGARDSSRLAESFRLLRTNLRFAGLDTPLSTLVVTSAVPGEGKTTVAVNLAITLANAGARVLLIDADLRRPGIHSRLGLPNIGGLTSCLLDDIVDGRLAFQFESVAAVPNLAVLTAGAPPANPAELLGSARMQRFIDSVLPHDGQPGLADIVVLDTPPAVAFADAALLSARAAGTLLVVDVQHSRGGQVQRAHEALSRVGAHVIGAVLNRAPEQRAESYYYDYYSTAESGADSAQERPPRARGWLRRVRRAEPSPRDPGGAAAAPAAVPSQSATDPEEPGVARVPAGRPDVDAASGGTNHATSAPPTG